MYLGPLMKQLFDEAVARGDDGDDATIFFARQLEYRKAQSYDILRAKLNIFDLLPITSEVPIGAESIVYESYDITGMAKVISNYADDVPRADVKGKEFISRIRSIGVSYGYSIQEARAAIMAGKPLEQRRANAAVQAHRRKFNEIGFYGDDVNKLPGWLTNVNIPAAAAAATGSGNSTLWKDKTADQILADMNNLVNGVDALTNSVEQPDTIVLPNARYTYLTSTRVGTYNDTTIMEFFLKAHPEITTVFKANEISAAQRANFMGANDPFTGEIMVAYRRSPDKVTFEIPLMFEQFAPQERNFEFVIPCHSRIGGVLIYYPLGMAVLENI